MPDKYEHHLSFFQKHQVYQRLFSELQTFQVKDPLFAAYFFFLGVEGALSLNQGKKR